MVAAFYKITAFKISYRWVSFGEFGVIKKKSLPTEQLHGVCDKFENARNWLVFSTKFNNLMIVLSTTVRVVYRILPLNVRSV